jgi:hypothetical protein
MITRNPVELEDQYNFLVNDLDHLRADFTNLLIVVFRWIILHLFPTGNENSVPENNARQTRL